MLKYITAIAFAVALAGSAAAGPLEDARVLDHMGLQEDATIVRQLHLAAAAGRPEAAYELAMLYLSCYIMVRYPYSCPDNEAAAGVLTDPAEHGHVPAQIVLGELYLFGGNGVSVDYQLALRLFEAAAAMNDSAAYYWLGEIYSIGLGVDADPDTATRWYLLAAANQGNADAQFELGLAYVDGDGMEVDYTVAYMWFDLAADGRIPAATARLDALTEAMTPDQIAGAQTLARNWLSQPCGTWPQPPCLLPGDGRLTIPSR